MNLNTELLLKQKNPQKIQYYGSRKRTGIIILVEFLNEKPINNNVLLLVDTSDIT